MYNDAYNPLIHDFLHCFLQLCYSSGAARSTCTLYTLRAMHTPIVMCTFPISTYEPNQSESASEPIEICCWSCSRPRASDHQLMKSFHNHTGTQDYPAQFCLDTNLWWPPTVKNIITQWNFQSPKDMTSYIHIYCMIN